MSASSSTPATVPEPLAIDGGQPVLSTPMPPMPHRWGAEELAQLGKAIDQQTLFYWNGPQTKELIRRFQQHYPLRDVMACSSGTASIHIAVEAAGIAPGDEVIVPPITDMGTVIGIIYQQAVPVFADLDPYSYNLDPADVRRKITSRTKAIILVHLAGNPAPIEPFRALAEEFNLVLIEDCAQAWGAEWQGRPVGTLGDIGCFSLNDFKHIGCGDGGLVGSNNTAYGSKLQLCGDKGYAREGGVVSGAIFAPNYRISELQSAVAAAQMDRLEGVTSRRHALGNQLVEQISGLPGLTPHRVAPGGKCTWWFQLHRLDAGRDRERYIAALQAEGVPATPGYIPRLIFQTQVFQEHGFFAGQWPLKACGQTEMDYREVSCPEADAILDRVIRIPIHQGMDEAYIDGMARAIRKVNAAV